MAKFQSWRGKYFPERQLFLRSEGRVRFLTIGSYTQLTLATAVSIVALWTAVTSYNFLTRQAVLEQKDKKISSMAAEYETLSSEFSSLEQDIEKRTRLLEERQRFLEDHMGQKAATPEGDDTETSGTAPDTATPDKNLSLLESLFHSTDAPVSVLSNIERRANLMRNLRQMEARQRELASVLLNETETAIAKIDTVIGPTELKQEDLIRNQTAGDTPLAMGGPYVPEQGFEPVFDETDNQVFLTLLDAAQRLEMVTNVLDSFPVGKPAEKYYLSSGFGRRIDPIKKTWARHPGLDLAGWPGTAIYATAPGTVVHAGWYGPYGQMVEIDHGNGFKTRYGHMRKLRVNKGDRVELGQQVGDMGKTGRVTDTHLHYEVWFEGKVRDPLPYMKAANDVRKIQGRYEEAGKS